MSVIAAYLETLAVVPHWDEPLVPAPPTTAGSLDIYEGGSTGTSTTSGTTLATDEIPSAEAVIEGDLSEMSLEELKNEARFIAEGLTPSWYASERQAGAAMRQSGLLAALEAAENQPGESTTEMLRTWVQIGRKYLVNPPEAAPLDITGIIADVYRSAGISPGQAPPMPASGTLWTIPTPDGRRYARLLSDEDGMRVLRDSTGAIWTYSGNTVSINLPGGGMVSATRDGDTTTLEINGTTAGTITVSGNSVTVTLPDGTQVTFGADALNLSVDAFMQMVNDQAAQNNNATSNNNSTGGTSGTSGAGGGGGSCRITDEEDDEGGGEGE